MDILRRYLFLYTRHRAAYLLGGVFLIATNAIVLTIPRIFGWAIDDLEAGASRGLVLSYAAAIIVLAAVQTVMRVGSRIFVLSVSRRIDYEIKGMLHDRLVRLAPSFFAATNTGDLMSRMTNDVMLVRALGGPGVLYFFSAVVLYALGLVYMVSISWRLTLVVFLPLPIVALLVRVLVHRVRDYVTKARIALSDLNTMVQENLAGVMVVKSFGLEEAQIER
ncbi:MAG: ABC transporter transmembrane domain-containing protein, partial [Vicinamibacterales bacterium]